MSLRIEDLRFEDGDGAEVGGKEHSRLRKHVCQDSRVRGGKG